LRATFVTVSLAAGKSETWVADRTGHHSSAQIANYRRAARTAAELGHTALDLLNDAIPELRLGDHEPSNAWRQELIRHLQELATQARGRADGVAQHIIERATRDVQQLHSDPKRAPNAQTLRDNKQKRNKHT
jgi:hypothetical protein